MKQILGNSPFTSLIGYALAGLTAADALTKAGATNWLQIAGAAVIAIFGRVSADSRNQPK